MKRTTFFAALAGTILVFVLAALTTVAQDENADAAAQPALPQSVALLDVNYFFERYPQFKEAMSEIKADAESAEKEVKQNRKELEDMQEQLKILVFGTPEHAKLEAKITAFKAEVAASLQTQKTGFLRRESRTYYDAYEAMCQEVGDYAKTHKIAVVFRVNDKPVNLAEPKDVIRRINRQVVWYDRKRDITRAILQRMTEKSNSNKSEQETDEEEPPAPSPNHEKLGVRKLSAIP